MLLTPMESVVGMAINAVSRKFEYEADRFACELPATLARAGVTAEDTKGMADMGERLGKALIALHVENLSTVWVDWL